MRIAVFAAVIFLGACASERQNSTPPPGVDFSGQWKLNVADSDDPTHLAQAAGGPAGTRSGGGGGGGQGGQGGGRGGGRGGGNAPGLGVGPATPPMSVLSEALRWPGKGLDIQQAGGVLTFASNGKSRVCQPGSHEKKSRHHGDPGDRDALPAEREAPPPRCSWDEKTLIVESRDADDERASFEEHYSITADGQRLVEMVSFKGARYNGFTATRVWDRIALSVN